MSFRAGDKEKIGGKPRSVYWRTQLPIDYIDTTLTINTYETVSADLSGGKPAKLWWVWIAQTNNGATDEDVTLLITINGTAYEVSTTLVSGTPKYIGVDYNLLAGDIQLYSTTNAVLFNNATVDKNQATPYNADSVGLIRVKQTTDVDVTSAQIEVNIVWDKLIPRGI